MYQENCHIAFMSKYYMAVNDVGVMLMLLQSESSLTLLKDDFQRPAPGVDPVGFEEVELPVCGNESVPLPSFVALGEEQTYVPACKGHVGGDVVASQTAAMAS